LISARDQEAMVDFVLVVILYGKFEGIHDLDFTTVLCSKERSNNCACYISNS
jgi:hypothetical protein